MGKSSQKGKITREFSAGGIVFKKTKGKTLWLLINPAETDRWQFPKGHIDGRERSKEAAIREVYEEANVGAKAIEKIGTSQYFFVLKGKRIFKTVIFFLMQYLSGRKKKADIEVNKARFFPLEEALEKLTFKNDKKMLEKAKSILDRGIQENLI